MKGRSQDSSPRSATPPDLIGEWSLTREIRDRRTGQFGTVCGTASFSWRSSGLIAWREDGVLSYGGRDLPFSRELLLEQRGQGWQVTFEDGRDFHPWSPGLPVEHLCRRDLYSGTVEAAGRPLTEWSVRWRVRGPEKDQQISTRLHRRP